MKSTSVINIFSTASLNQDFLVKEIGESKQLVTEGRYLISIFPIEKDWEPKTPAEAIIVQEVLGPIERRNFEWEYFGNGAIRCYKDLDLSLESTFQWVALRRFGDKPYKRIREVSAATLSRSQIPVTHKVFTRDVANNVWHLKSESFQERVSQRFANLLAWSDERVIQIKDGEESRDFKRKKINLEKDLVGVPEKGEYFWASKDNLF